LRGREEGGERGQRREEGGGFLVSPVIALLS